MKQAQKPDHISLQNLINRIREGHYVIPDFQREFEWSAADIRDLIRSIVLDYYIGSLLLWKGKAENFEALSCEKIYGHEGEDRREYIVLDGQQRLTALAYACFAPNKPLPNRKSKYVFYIRVDKWNAEEYDDAFGYEALSRSWSKFFNDRNQLYRNHYFPVFALGYDLRELVQWLRGYEDYWEKLGEESADNAQIGKQNAEMAQQFGSQIIDILSLYQISYIELGSDLEIDKICDIFTQINSKGVKLDIFDLMNALLKPKGLQLKLLWRVAQPRLSFIQYERLNIYVLQVMSILLQGYCSPKYLYYLMPGQQRKIRLPDKSYQKDVLVKSIDEFEKSWNLGVGALENAIKLIQHPQEFGAIKPEYVPYISILPCLAALRTHVKSLPGEQRMGANRKIARWYWASIFLNRYSSSVETTATKDFNDLREWMQNEESEPQLIKEFIERYRNMDLTREGNKSSSIYRGIFNLFVIRGSRDWTTGDAPRHDSLDDHHIVPIARAGELGIGDSVHSILNRTPLSSDTNRGVINDRLPNEYLPELINHVGREKVLKVMASHMISAAAVDILLEKPFTRSHFDDFIVERRRCINLGIEELILESRVDLPADLRKLDADIEMTELRLRTLVANRLDGDGAKLPNAVLSNIRERVDRAIKKSPNVNPTRYSTLDGMLEYADLRDIQQTIVNGAIWATFQDVFSAKPELEKRFDQLAELRNGIRHSRTVNDVMRHDGEAAIKWFDGVFNRVGVSAQPVERDGGA